MVVVAFVVVFVVCCVCGVCGVCGDVWCCLVFVVLFGVCGVV